jgi:hypothetical protein
VPLFRIEFVTEFKVISEELKNEEAYGVPFAPEYVYDALRGRKRFDSMKVKLEEQVIHCRNCILKLYKQGRQEDAEEFLCFLLDGLHEEMIAGRSIILN